MKTYFLIKAESERTNSRKSLRTSISQELEIKNEKIANEEKINSDSELNSLRKKSGDWNYERKICSFSTRTIGTDVKGKKKLFSIRFFCI